MSIMVNISGVILTEFFLCIYYTKSQIGVLVTTFIEFSDQLVITQDNQNAP